MLGSSAKKIFFSAYSFEPSFCFQNILTSSITLTNADEVDFQVHFKIVDNMYFTLDVPIEDESARRL